MHSTTLPLGVTLVIVTLAVPLWSQAPTAKPAAHPAPPPAGASFHVEEASIADIRAAMKAGRLTCRALVQAYLRRIEAYDKIGPAINAIVVVNPEALAQADQLDTRIAKSGFVGPLHCVPAIVKDNFETIGLQSANGSLSLQGFVSAKDAFLLANDGVSIRTGADGLHTEQRVASRPHVFRSRLVGGDVDPARLCVRAGHASSPAAVDHTSASARPACGVGRPAGTCRSFVVSGDACDRASRAARGDNRNCPADEAGTPEQWKRVEREPRAWEPRTTVGHDKVVVTFYTISSLGSRRSTVIRMRSCLAATRSRVR